MRSKILDVMEPWLLKQIVRRPWVVGISGAQGIGKTTLCKQGVESLERQGLRAVAVSIDDFYLTHDEQAVFARAHAGNPYFQQRGYPGTHNLKLGERTLQQLRQLKKGESLRIPRYDKSAFSGQGDRMHEKYWQEVTGPFDVIFFEGWMLGFRPANDTNLTPAMMEVDGYLRDYDCWWRLVDSWLFLEPAELKWIVEWRVEAEKQGMIQAEVQEYVLKFIPAYEIYLEKFRVYFQENLSEIGLHLLMSKRRDMLEVKR